MPSLLPVIWWCPSSLFLLVSYLCYLIMLFGVSCYVIVRFVGLVLSLDSVFFYFGLLVYLFTDATDTVPLSVQPIFPVETTTESHYLLDTTVDSAAQNQPSVTQSSSTTNTCYCPCNTVGSKWDYLLNGTYTLDELKVILHDELEELRREVAIDKSHTLAAIYRKRCMNDDRPTSKVMGAFGAVMMCIPVALIVISDIAGFICRRRGQYSLK